MHKVEPILACTIYNIHVPMNPLSFVYVYTSKFKRVHLWSRYDGLQCMCTPSHTVVEVLLTEIDYRLAREDDGLMRVIVEVRDEIATPLFVRLLPREAPYVASEINAGNIQLVPIITEEVTAELIPTRPQFANSE